MAKAASRIECERHKSYPLCHAKTSKSYKNTQKKEKVQDIGRFTQFN